jgi:MFS transporter, AAHS family, 3-hydroxyphenylpropionic acid transporter
MPNARIGTNGGATVTFVLCILAALADGYDLQATGITAIHFGRELQLSTQALSWIFAANSLGLFVGASFGGWLADRLGRRPVMIISMFTFGFFSILTALVTTGAFLAEIRLLTGIGLGAALANIIALVAERSPPANRSASVMLITASHPLGGAIPGTIMTLFPELDWRVIFHVGGWWPLLLAGVMVIWLPESPEFLAERAKSRATPAGVASPSIATALFGEGRTPATIMLWTGFFFCVLAIYLIISWLPSLLVSQGYSSREATFAALAFPLGGSIGTLVLGLLVSRWSRKGVVIGAFAGIVASVSALAAAPHDIVLVLAASLATGFFVIGSQFLLYGLSPTYYPGAVRGTGVGTAVAVGRLGSIAGPLLAGALLGAGQSAGQVLLSIVPGVVLAFVAAFMLTRIPHAAD